MENIMTFVLALYAGRGIDSLELVEVSADPDLTEAVAEMMLADPPEQDDDREGER